MRREYNTKVVKYNRKGVNGSAEVVTESLEQLKEYTPIHTHDTMVA